MNPKIESKYVQVDNTNIHYLEVGQGEPILLIHGFPTSSYLWRNIMLDLSDSFKIIAIDLPGSGKSDKKLEDSYSFKYYDRLLTEFLNEINVDKISLGVHDVGGPIGLYWLVRNMSRVKRLILFNTLVYSKFSWAVKLFAFATIVPGIRHWITSPNGIKKAIEFGIFNQENISDDMIKNYQSPFLDKNARKALLKSVQRLSMKGFEEIEEKLHSFRGPIQIIYGENDKILPEVATTMNKIKKNMPQSRIISIPNCGHFLQEEYPSEISAAILEFMNESDQNV